MTKQEFLNRCKEAKERNGDRTKVVRHIWDSRYDVRKEDEWFINFMVDEAVEGLYDQYAEAPMIKVNFEFTSLQDKEESKRYEKI